MAATSREPTIIHAETLISGGRSITDRWITIEGDEITEVSQRKRKAHFSGIVTPAFIDAHSHIGMFRAGEPDGESEGNETLSQILPLCDPLNSIYFDDRAFSDAIDFGVLYSCVMPGSGNLFGGRSRVIKNFARHVGEAQLHDYGFKMALGHNPRSTGGWKGERPNTRMGIYHLLERRFDETLQKEKRATTALERKKVEIGRGAKKPTEKAKDLELAEREFANEFSAEDTALLELLHGKKPVKIHVHKEDDVLYLLHLQKKYGIKPSAEHAGDVFHREIFELLRDNGVPVIAGPLGIHPYKVELKHASYANVQLLMESGVEFGLMTDHPVINASLLRDSLRYFLIFGMSNEEALRVITEKNAALVGVAQKLGTITTGKTASLLVWDRDPLHLAAIPRVVIAEGAVVRHRLHR